MGFSWPKYLEHCKAKAAPVKLFKDPFPYSKNHFRVGMKLEGIDPEHPSRYCVLTIAEVVGESAVKDSTHIILLQHEIYKML